MDMHTVEVGGTAMQLRSTYKPSKVVGSGSYGVVVRALDLVSSSMVAIKRIRPASKDLWDARHTLREVRLLRLLDGHPNIIALRDMWRVANGGPSNEDEVYLVMDLYSSDLHKVIQSKTTVLSEDHVKLLASQLLSGVEGMHDLGILHRDLKPGNLLVDGRCRLVITDFGLARRIGTTPGATELTKDGEEAGLVTLTEYVVTRWYRSPELLLAPQMAQTTGVDLWSVGLIIAEVRSSHVLTSYRPLTHPRPQHRCSPAGRSSPAPPWSSKPSSC